MFKAERQPVSNPSELPKSTDEASGLRKKPRPPQDRSRDREEYLSPRELRPSKLPKETPATKVVFTDPEQMKALQDEDARKQAAIAEQIRMSGPHGEFFRAAEHALTYTDRVLDPLKKAMKDQELRPDTIDAQRKKLTTLLEYLRENLQRQGLDLPQKEVKKIMGTIHESIRDVGETIYQLDQLSRRHEMQQRYAGGEYEFKPVKPKEIPNTELQAMAKKWNQKPPEPSTWSKMKSAWNRFWK